MNALGLPLGTATSVTERGLLWLPLLQRLAVVSPRSVVWKNASSALEGQGDLDVIAPPADWAAIESEFRSWAGAAGLHPVAVCRHVPGSMFLLAADPMRAAFFELDIKSRGSFRGTTIFRPSDLQPLSEMDSRGFQRLRPGAEGVLKLILNGTTDDGRLNPHRVQRERIVELLQADPLGAEQAARLFGSARRQVIKLVDQFLRGEWSRSRMLTLRARLRLALFLEPAYLVRRFWSQLGPHRQCGGIKALIKDNRLVPGDRARLQQLVRAHPAPYEVRPV